MKNWILLSFALVITLLQTGCAGITESSNLSPTSIRSSFDSAQVSIKDGKLLISIQDHRNLYRLRVVQATTSTYAKVTILTEVEHNVVLEDPHQIQLGFTPAPTIPFSVHLVAKVDGHTLTLRADYYGSHTITY